jgi:very-short-patch-repair endonuclease
VGPQHHAYGADRGHVATAVGCAAAAREAALAELASRQHGVVSRRQLVELGFGRQAILRRLQSRRLQRLHAGVYAVGHWALTPASRDLAAVLACGPSALLSHRAAGARHGLLRAGGGPIDVVAPRGCKAKPGITVHRRRLIHPDDRDEVDRIPITSVARTIVDLAEVLDERRLTAVVNEAEVMRVFDLPQIEQTRSRLATRRAERRLRNVLAIYTEPPGYSTTEAERLFLGLCKQHGLPRPQRVHAAGYELDFYWADARLAIEVDGYAFHRTRRAFEKDRRRGRELAAFGIQVERVTWADVTGDVDQLAAELKAIRRHRLP